MIDFRSALAACFAACLTTCSLAQQDTAPHIIVLVADDLGLHDAPCNGRDIRMPFLDSLCATSRVFERAYTHPYCTASRATLLTGRHPLRHGADDVRSQATKLPLSEETLAERIKAQSQARYETAAFGKWHLADDENGSEQNPNLQGFDHYAGNPRQHHTYRYFDYDWFENGRRVGEVSTYKTTHITNEVIAHFEQRSDAAPQLTVVNFTSPHIPYHAPPERLHSFGALPQVALSGTLSNTPGENEYRLNRREPRFDRYYHAMLEALDTEIERLVTTLSQQSDRPIVFLFLGDNGSAAEVFAPIEGNRVRSKATLYDGGVRVPLMIWSSQPEVFPITPGRSERLIHLADLFPTLSELAGVSVTPDDAIDGRAFTADIKSVPPGEETAREFAFIERGNDERLPFAYGAVNRDGLKLILRETERETNYSPGIRVEIYDTEVDPLEADNLFDTPCSAPADDVLALFDSSPRKPSRTPPIRTGFCPISIVQRSVMRSGSALTVRQLVANNGPIEDDPGVRLLKVDVIRPQDCLSSFL